MALRARVKLEPGLADQLCIKQEPELLDVDWGNNEAGWGNSSAEYSASLRVKEEPAPLDQHPTSVLQDWMSLQQDIFNPTVSNEPGLMQEPMWMGGPGPDAPDTPQVKQEAPPPPAPAAPLDGKYSSLVRDCWVRVERCAVPRGAAERFLARLTASRPRGRPPAPRDPLTASRPRGPPRDPLTVSRPRGRRPAPRERQVAMAQYSGLIKSKPKRKHLYICHICKREFALLPHFIAHKQIHVKNNEVSPVFLPRPDVDPAKPYLCEICKAGFDDLKTLKVHALIHAKCDKTPYACEICNIRFSSIRQFNDHSTFHAELRPFPCRICQKRFALKSLLGKHMFQHKLERNLCKACEEKRALRLLGSLMLRSEDLEDEDEDEDRCETCGRDT